MFMPRFPKNGRIKWILPPDGNQDTTFEGEVKDIVKATNSAFSMLPENTNGNCTKVTEKVQVKISIDHPSSSVLPGMNAKVKMSI